MELDLSPSSWERSELYFSEANVAGNGLQAGAADEKTAQKSNLLTDKIKSILDNFEKLNKEADLYGDSLSGKRTKITIQELNNRYANRFAKVSVEFEKWASRTRLLLKRMDKVVGELETIKRISRQSKMAFSSIQMALTIGAMILDQMHSSASTKVLYSASGFACLSFGSALFDNLKTNAVIEKLLQELQNEEDEMQNLKMLLQDMLTFERDVDDLFPHGIDLRFVKMIHEPAKVGKKRYDRMQEFLEFLSRTEQSTQISVAILLSNGVRDPRLLEDETFLSKVQTFSSTSTASKWWNRLKYRGVWPVKSGSSLLEQTTALKKTDSFAWHSFNMLSVPIFTTSGMPAVTSLLLNTLVAVDAYSELQRRGFCREVSFVKRLKNSLEEDYRKMVELYGELSPHND